MSEVDVSDLLSVARAIEIIDATPVSLRAAVERSLHEAEGLVLAEDLRADRDYPPFDRSLMDGFAVRCAETSAAGAELKIIGEIAAGRPAPPGALGAGAGEAFAIMTGAPLPEGADGIVPVEETQRIGAGAGDRVRIARAASPGRFIGRRGSDARAGEIVLAKGMRLGPRQLAVAATVGAARVRVYEKPRIAVLGSGDELVGIGEEPGEAQIRNSNNLMLAALLRRMGCEVTDGGIVRDDPASVRAALAGAIDAYDAVFISGGMSMGTYDYVPRTLLELGVELKVTKLRIKPGKPFVFGVRNRVSGFGYRGSGEEGVRGFDPKPETRDPLLWARAAGQPDVFVFGLPGNPVSAFVCTVRLASRLIGRLCGETGASEAWASATISEALPANGPREFYLPVVFGRSEGVARPLKWKGSADVFTLAAASALLVREADAPALPAGAAVRVLEV